MRVVRMRVRETLTRALSLSLTHRQRVAALASRALTAEQAAQETDDDVDSNDDVYVATLDVVGAHTRAIDALRTLNVRMCCVCVGGGRLCDTVYV
jgi:hypothetical protein